MRRRDRLIRARVERGVGPAGGGATAGGGPDWRGSSGKRPDGLGGGVVGSRLRLEPFLLPRIFS